MTKFVAEWQQRNSDAGATWRPASFSQARAVLAGELRRNLNQWSGLCYDPAHREEYESALRDIEVMPGTANGCVWILAHHTLSLMPDPRTSPR